MSGPGRHLAPLGTRPRIWAAPPGVAGVCVRPCRWREPPDAALESLGVPGNQSADDAVFADEVVLDDGVVLDGGVVLEAVSDEEVSLDDEPDEPEDELDDEPEDAPDLESVL